MCKASVLGCIISTIRGCNSFVDLKLGQSLVQCIGAIGQAGTLRFI